GNGTLCRSGPGMVSQTQVNGRDRIPPAGEAMRNGVMHFAHDLWSLAELQCQLFFIDLKETASRSTIPLVLLACGIVFGVTAIPLLVVSAAWLLVDEAGLSHEAAYFIMAVVAVIVAVACIWFGWIRLKRSLTSLTRSRDELRDNLRWIKQSLVN